MNDRREAVQAPDMTWAQCIARSADPFRTSQSQHIKTGGDAHHTWYMFLDGSQLQFDVTNRMIQP